MAKTETDIAALAEKMFTLPTAQKLTLAAMLVQGGRLDVAERVAEAAVEDLQARRLLNIKRAPLVSSNPERSTR